MKPTQEQVIAWAREAGLDWLIWQEGKCKLKFNDDEVFLFAALAYEAGRKDENEACAQEADTPMVCNDCSYTIAAAIRARRK